MNFKSFREDKLKLSQEEFANFIGEDVSKIVLWEKNNQPSLDVLEKIVKKTGMDFNTVLSYEKPKPKAINTKNTWKKADFTKKSIVEYINVTLEKIKVPGDQKRKYVDNLRSGIEKNLVKPSISIVGRSDTGKSTLINALIGMEKMPTSWTPTTSIAVYIKHISDRPEFIKDDAWVFADSIDEEDLWDSKRLFDEQYCNKWKIAQGGVEILRSFGTRQGDMFKKNAGSAVIFLDAPILQVCDIVDLPGFGTEKESDDTITFKAAQKTDVLIYLSQATGFMRIEDITYLKENIRSLPVWEKKDENQLKPLSNLFVIASQAHGVSNGNPTELSNILLKGYENFNKTISSEYWTNRKNMSGYYLNDYSKEALSKRFFTYTTDIPSLCEKFNKELKQILEILPEIIDERTKKFIREYVKTMKPNLQAQINHFEEISVEREKYETLLDEIDTNELNRSQENGQRKDDIKEVINTISIESTNEFSQFCSEFINTDSLVEMLKDKKIKNKKEEVECFASKLQDIIQEKCDEILGVKAQILSDKTKDYIEKYSDSIKVAFDKSYVEVDFDSRYAFASGLAKFGIVGGLSAYILGNAAFILGSIPFVFGIGGSVAIGAISLGPLGIAIGLIIATSLGVAKLFGASWQKSVAKKIVKAYDDNNVIEQFRNAITEYWKQTETAFDKATEELDNEWSRYVDTLRNTVNNYDIEEIENNIIMLKNLLSFFENIPL